MNIDDLPVLREADFREAREGRDNTFPNLFLAPVVDIAVIEYIRRTSSPIALLRGAGIVVEGLFYVLGKNENQDVIVMDEVIRDYAGVCGQLRFDEEFKIPDSYEVRSDRLIAQPYRILSQDFQGYKSRDEPVSILKKRRTSVHPGPEITA